MNRTTALRISLFTLSLLLAGCGTVVSGRLIGNQYQSKSGDISCNFIGMASDAEFSDYSGDDGERASSNLYGIDIERIERVVLGKTKNTPIKDADGLADTF